MRQHAEHHFTDNLDISLPHRPTIKNKLHTKYSLLVTWCNKPGEIHGWRNVRPDVLTRVDSQLYRIRTITAESRGVRISRLML